MLWFIIIVNSVLRTWKYLRFEPNYADAHLTTDHLTTRPLLIMSRRTIRCIKHDHLVRIHRKPAATTT